MTPETVPEEMAENVTDEVAVTEIITVKMAETEEVVKSVDNFRKFLGGTHPKKVAPKTQELSLLYYNGLYDSIGLLMTIPCQPLSDLRKIIAANTFKSL